MEEYTEGPENPFIIRKEPEASSKTPNKVYTAADFDDLPFTGERRDSISGNFTLNIKQCQAILSKGINLIMSDFVPADENYISNLRVFHQIVSDGRVDELKSVLVDKFSEYYGHTLYDENPVDVLTMHHIEANANIMWAKSQEKLSN